MREHLAAGVVWGAHTVTVTETGTKTYTLGWCNSSGHPVPQGGRRQWLLPGFSSSLPDADAPMKEAGPVTAAGVVGVWPGPRLRTTVHAAAWRSMARGGPWSSGRRHGAESTRGSVAPAAMASASLPRPRPWAENRRTARPAGDPRRTSAGDRCSRRAHRLTRVAATAR